MSPLGAPRGMSRKCQPAVSGRTLRSYSLLFNPQFQSFKLLLGHALQSHRCSQIQSGNVFHSVAARYLATEFLYFWVSAHFQKHFIRIGDGQSLFNQAMLNQNAMIRRYRQRTRMGLRSALVLFWVFHCTILSLAKTPQEPNLMHVTRPPCMLFISNDVITTPASRRPE